MTSSPKQVLLIEDDPSDVMLFQEAVKGANVSLELKVAGDGDEALSYLRGAARPSLVLLDWRLPKMNGAEVLREIRADSSLKLLPVIVLTTSASQTDVRAAYALGANAFLTKPTGLEQLVALASSIASFWLHFATLPPQESAPSS